MENEAQWKEVIEFSKQVQEIAEKVLNKHFDNYEGLKAHFHSPELFLGSFKVLLTKKNEITHAKKKATQVALQRLNFTAEMVEGMRKEIEKDRQQITTLVDEAKKCGEHISKEKDEVLQVSKRLEDEEAAENETTAASRKLKEECEAELASVMPAIEKALQSLDQIKPKDIAEIKTMRNPPAVVKLVIAAIAVMLEVEPEPKKNDRDDLRDLYWAPAVKMLGDVNFMKRLRDYNLDNIKEGIMDTLRKEFYNKPDFEPTRVARASVAAESLCRWIVAIEKYDKVSKEILKPKREALKHAEERLGHTIQAMKKDRTALSTTEQKVLELETRLNETEQKKKSFEDQVDQKDKAIARATALIEGLTVEAAKWSQMVEEYRKCYMTMVGDTILASATLTYLGPLPQESRDEALKEWATLIGTSKEKLKCSEPGEFSLHKFANEPLTLEQWHTADFPQDPYWIDNATMANINCHRQLWPLCVDPLGVANKWIRNIEKDHSLEIVKPKDDNFLSTLKNCLSSGKPLLLEDITEPLDPHLEKIFTRKAGKATAVESFKFGEETITVHKEFRLYMTTRLRIVKPFFYCNVNAEKGREANFIVINFIPSVPENLALQHALLSGVVAREKKKLEAERLAAIAKVAANHLKFLEIGEKVLQVLSAQQGGRLISIEMTLAVLEAKKPLAEMEEQMKEDEATMNKIDSSLNPFRKATGKLAKKFCSPDDEELEVPFDLEAFLDEAL